MILYHGTSSIAGDQILRDGMLKCDCKRSYSNLPTVLTPNGFLNANTTNGYVYLTDSFYKALRYAVNTHIIKIQEFDQNHSYIYVFKFSEINVDKLTSDFDEERIKKGLPKTFASRAKQYRFADDISLKSSYASCLRIPYNDPFDENFDLVSEVCRLLPEITKGEYTTKEQEKAINKLINEFESTFHWETPDFFNI